MPVHHQLDHETALSAVRNLNGTDVGGRPLRIDLADSDPFLEGKTTVRGELLDGGYPGPSEPRARGSRSAANDPESFLANLPTGKPVAPGVSALDGISQTLASMPPNQLMEVLAQFKAFVITHPDQAKTLLVKHPQFSYALFQSLLLNKIVDSAILERMLASSRGPGGPPPVHAPPARPPVPAPPPHLQGYPPPHSAGYPPSFPPPQSNMYSLAAPVGPPAQPYYRPPAPAAVAAPPAAPAVPEIADKDRAMLMQVLSLTPEQINGLAEKDRTAIMALRNQFMGQLGTAP
ncbi:hinge domain of cleavage stimulation factor subunit 2-domain-containing protein [Crepidotus variabilis]|uniref:Hinge domain of cleavage stimulation factor subunit 2-domain-containing protein n=1 Tax=Crepidotus variabilis TaxID=179855 RepID=A0A9P6EKI6_9AGAR|nr:hinge domain of cleavage stimulation factor subunit 2-domain-containing protein [Crepidotus variabilis]